MAPGWTVDERRGDAATLHAVWPAVEASPERRAVAICRVSGPAVVLGSTQPGGVVDPIRAARSGVAVARRRSGGGAVLVTPEEPAWFDLWLPATDPLWCADVARAFDWVGDTWVAALQLLGLSGLEAHRSGLLSCTSWSAEVCFGGVGRGEVVTGDGRKVVGLAQRRTRAGAWFHGACALCWDPAPLVEVLSLRPGERAAAVRELAAAAVGVVDLAVEAGRSAIDGPAVASALLDALPPTPGS
ncbi:MAG: lipoyl protein ligase domain-containing protein [Acidimicrobiales bacterium]